MNWYRRLSVVLDGWPSAAYVSFLCGLGDLVMLAGNFSGQTMIHPLIGVIVLISCTAFFAMALMKKR